MVLPNLTTACSMSSFCCNNGKYFCLKVCNITIWILDLRTKKKKICSIRNIDIQSQKLNQYVLTSSLTFVPKLKKFPTFHTVDASIRVPTQNIQGALVVGDDDIGSLCLQVLPAAHFKSKTQQILHVTNHEANNPEGKKVNYRPE